MFTRAWCQLVRSSPWIIGFRALFGKYSGIWIFLYIKSVSWCKKCSRNRVSLSREVSPKDVLHKGKGDADLIILVLAFSCSLESIKLWFNRFLHLIWFKWRHRHDQTGRKISRGKLRFCHLGPWVYPLPSPPLEKAESTVQVSYGLHVETPGQLLAQGWTQQHWTGSDSAWGLDPRSVTTEDFLLFLRERHMWSQAVFLHRLCFTISFELMKIFVTKT